LGIHELNIPDMTEEKLVGIIHNLGFSLNRMSGVPGNYYTVNRYEDLIRLCQEIIDAQ